MAHPKRRQSNTRTAKRRTHDKAVAPTLAVCPNCGAYYVYHTVCPTSHRMPHLWLLSWQGCYQDGRRGS